MKSFLWFIILAIGCVLASLAIVLLAEILGLTKRTEQQTTGSNANEFLINTEIALNENEYSPTLTTKQPEPGIIPDKQDDIFHVVNTQAIRLYDAFEQNPETSELSWKPTGLGSDGFTEWSSEQALSGKHALKISAIKPSEQGWPGWITTIDYHPEKNYRLQVSYYTPDGANAWLEQSFLDQNGRLLMGFSTGCPRHAKINQWTQVSHLVNSASIPENSKFIRVGLRQCLNHSKGKLTHLFFDDVILTAYPAPR